MGSNFLVLCVASFATQFMKLNFATLALLAFALLCWQWIQEYAMPSGILAGRPTDAGGFEGLSKAAGKFVHLGPQGAHANLSWGRTHYVLKDMGEGANVDNPAILRTAQRLLVTALSSRSSDAL